MQRGERACRVSGHGFQRARSGKWITTHHLGCCLRRGPSGRRDSGGLQVFHSSCLFRWTLCGLWSRDLTEERCAVGSVMSVLIATQHFNTATSKMVSQATRPSFWPRGVCVTAFQPLIVSLWPVSAPSVALARAAAAIRLLKCPGVMTGRLLLRWVSAASGAHLHNSATSSQGRTVNPTCLRGSASLRSPFAPNPHKVPLAAAPTASLQPPASVAPAGKFTLFGG